VFPEDLEAEPESGPDASGEPAEVTAEELPAAAPTREQLRFIKPKLTQAGDEGVETGEWDAATDLEEVEEGGAGWDDEVATPTGHLAGAV
jgi:hypothetical protein